MDDDGVVAVGGDDDITTTTSMATLLFHNQTMMLVTRPPYTNAQNQFLQFLLTVAPIPSWIASGLVLYVVARRQQQQQHENNNHNTYHRLMFGIALYNFVWSLQFTLLSGSWSIPQTASEWVVGARATTNLWCEWSGFLFYQFWGTAWYIAFLLVYHVLLLQQQQQQQLSMSSLMMARRIEPYWHVVSNLVPWIYGIVAVATTGTVLPSPQLPGTCYAVWLDDYDPYLTTTTTTTADCTTTTAVNNNEEEYLVPCDSNQQQQQLQQNNDDDDEDRTIIIKTLVTAATAILGTLWLLILMGTMVSLTIQLWKVAHKLRLVYGSSSSTTIITSTTTTREQLYVTRQTAVRGLLYLTTTVICAIPAFVFALSPWDVNEEYREIHFTVAILVICVTTNQGVFHALIYFWPRFRELTSETGVLFFLRPVCQLVEKLCCCCCCCWRRCHWWLCKSFGGCRCCCSRALRQQQQAAAGEQPQQQLPLSSSPHLILRGRSDRSVPGTTTTTSGGDCRHDTFPTTNNALATTTTTALHNKKNKKQQHEGKIMGRNCSMSWRNYDFRTSSNYTSSTAFFRSSELLTSSEIFPTNRRNSNSGSNSPAVITTNNNNNNNNPVDQEAGGNEEDTNPPGTCEAGVRMDGVDLQTKEDDKEENSGVLPTNKQEENLSGSPSTEAPMLVVRVPQSSASTENEADEIASNPQPLPSTIDEGKEPEIEGVGCDKKEEQAPLYVRDNCFHETHVAPAGSTGIYVRESPHGPVVWAVDEYSPLLECIEVGDIVVAIDCVSTRGMEIHNVVDLFMATRFRARRITVERHETTLMDRQDFELVFESEDEQDEEAIGVSNETLESLSLHDPSDRQ